MKAMYEKLRELYPNAEIVIVNYVKKKHWRKNMIHVLHYRIGIDTPASYCQKVKQLITFTKYEHMLPRTESVKSAEDTQKLGLDLLVFGSDEIWNINGTGYHPLKSGYGIEKNNQKIIAYAPSVGSVTAETEIPEKAKRGLHNFAKLPGRDTETVKMIERTTGLKADKMLDPTFLYDFDKDIDIENIKPYKKPYILIYDCKLTDSQSKQLRAYADRNGLEIIGAGDYKKYYDRVTICLTPYEWVSLFRNAEKVITGTFHGTVFSIKYDRDFVCYPTEKNRINKISSLLDDMKLSERLLALGNENSLCRLADIPVDYEYAHNYIEEKKLEADKFLLME